MVGRAQNTNLYNLLNAKSKFGLFPFSVSDLSVNSFFKIEGIFEMTTPNILLGYFKQPIIWPDSSVERVPENRSSVYLTISISLEPLFDPIELTTSNLECTELSDVKVTWKYKIFSGIQCSNVLI